MIIICISLYRHTQRLLIKTIWRRKCFSPNKWHQFGAFGKGNGVMLCIYKKRNYSGMSVTVNKGWVGFLSNVKNLLSSTEVKTKGSTSNSNNMEEFQISIRRRNMCIYFKYLDLNLKDMHLYCFTWALLWNVLLLTCGLNGSVIFWPGLGSHADLFCNLQSAFEVFVQQQLLKRSFLLCTCD